MSCHPASNKAKLQRLLTPLGKNHWPASYRSLTSVQHFTQFVSAKLGILMMADTWFILCPTGQTLVHLCLVYTQQPPATSVKTCCHLHLSLKQGMAISRSLSLKGFTQLQTQRRCQWRRHRIANLAMLVVDIAPELEVVREPLHHTPLCCTTDTAGNSADTISTHTKSPYSSQEDTSGLQPGLHVKAAMV